MAFGFRFKRNSPPTLKSRIWFEIICCICRYIFAITFIVSGFTKVMNTPAFENVVEQYFVTYGLTVPDWLIDTCAIGLSVAELAIGIMLLFKIFVRIMSIASLVLMSIFTLLTLLNATLFPIDDCGCFGELIDLTSWQSFIKNIILLPMSVAIWYNYRRELVFETWLRDVIVTCVTIAACLGLSLWNYMGLPFEFFDRTPYKTGVDLHDYHASSESTKESEGSASQTPAQCNEVVVYRNLKTNELLEFSLNDKAWYAIDADTENWVWVETKVEEVKVVDETNPDIWIGDSNNNIDKTNEILEAPKAYLLFITDDEYDDDVREKFEAVEAYAAANGGVVVYVTPIDLTTVTAKAYPCYNMDSRVMKLMLRADYGLVLLEKGVIAEKYNYRHIPY